MVSQRDCGVLDKQSVLFESVALNMCVCFWGGGLGGYFRRCFTCLADVALCCADSMPQLPLV